MRITINISRAQAEQIKSIRKAKNLSRKKLIQLAVDLYIAQNEPTPHNAFGLWKNCAIDGLVYQQRMRAEWH